MKKMIAALLLLISLLPVWATAEKIEKTLSPDIADAPWCEGIIFDMVMEQPQDFPFPIPCYQTEYAQVDVKRIRTLLEQYGLPKPDKEKWYNGEDEINMRNYVFAEMNYGRYQLYSYPWGARMEIEGHPQEEKLQTAVDICQHFLADAGIAGIEEPYYVVQRIREYRQSNAFGSNVVDEYQTALDEKQGVSGDQFTGIGLRYTLGGLPVAVLALYDPQVKDRKDSYFDSWGAMTIRDDGIITHFELRNYRTIEKELEPYAGPVCSWEDAVSAVLDKMINHTQILRGESEESHWLEDHERLRIVHVEPSLAISPGGTTFPVWAVVYEEQYRLKDGTPYYNSGVQYVDARTGKPTDAGEDMMP